MSSEYEPQITPEMRARYLLRRRDDLAKFEQAFASGDFATIRAVAHQIKGNAATFSFTDLEALAIAIELAAESASLNGVAEQICKIRDWLDQQAA